MKAALLGLALSGCAGMSETHQIVLRPLTAPSHEIRVYAEAQHVDRPVDDVALVQVFAWGTDAEPAAIFSRLALRGAELGCDAVVHARVDRGRTQSVGSGVCVKWQQTTAR